MFSRVVDILCKTRLMSDVVSASLGGKVGESARGGKRARESVRRLGQVGVRCGLLWSVAWARRDCCWAEMAARAQAQRAATAAEGCFSSADWLQGEHVSELFFAPPKRALECSNPGIIIISVIIPTTIVITIVVVTIASSRRCSFNLLCFRGRWGVARKGDRERMREGVWGMVRVRGGERTLHPRFEYSIDFDSSPDDSALSKPAGAQRALGEATTTTTATAITTQHGDRSAPPQQKHHHHHHTWPMYVQPGTPLEAQRRVAGASNIVVAHRPGYLFFSKADRASNWQNLVFRTSSRKASGCACGARPHPITRPANVELLLATRRLVMDNGGGILPRAALVFGIGKTHQRNLQDDLPACSFPEQGSH